MNDRPFPYAGLNGDKCLQCGGVLPVQNDQVMAYGYGAYQDKPGVSPFCSTRCMDRFRDEHPDL